MNSRWILLFLLLSPAALLVSADEDEVEEEAVVDDEVCVQDYQFLRLLLIRFDDDWSLALHVHKYRRGENAYESC